MIRKVHGWIERRIRISESDRIACFLAGGDDVLDDTETDGLGPSFASVRVVRLGNRGGLWDKPTVINNVETYSCAPFILDRGGEW